MDGEEEESSRRRQIMMMMIAAAVEYGANQFSPFARNTKRCGGVGRRSHLRRLRCVVNDERVAEERAVRRDGLSYIRLRRIENFRIPRGRGEVS